MNTQKYHIVERPVGWMGLLGTDRGLQRLSLKPSPGEALDELGPALEQALHEPDGFDSELACLERCFRGESGALDTMLSKIADFYEEEVDTAVAGMLTLMEPIMIAFLGVVVGGIVIAMYLPIFDLISRMSG